MFDSQQNVIDSIEDVAECLRRVKQAVYNFDEDDGWSNPTVLRMNYLSSRLDAALDNYDLAFRLYIKEAASARTQDGSIIKNPFNGIIPQEEKK